MPPSTPLPQSSADSLFPELDNSGAAPDPSLLNIYEVDIDEKTHHFICMLRPDDAKTSGIPMHMIIGQFEPDAAGEFQPASFRPNTGFFQAYEKYMNIEVVRTPELMLLAQEHPGKTLNLVDPRQPSGNGEDGEGEGDGESHWGPDGQPPECNVLGRFRVDAEGWIIAKSFRYNPNHRWFEPRYGPSGVLFNTDYYRWLLAYKPDDADADAGAGAAAGSK